MFVFVYSFDILSLGLVFVYKTKYLGLIMSSTLWSGQRLGLGSCITTLRTLKRKCAPNKMNGYYHCLKCMWFFVFRSWQLKGSCCDAMRWPFRKPVGRPKELAWGKGSPGTNWKACSSASPSAFSSPKRPRCQCRGPGGEQDRFLKFPPQSTRATTPLVDCGSVAAGASSPSTGGSKLC